MAHRHSTLAPVARSSACPRALPGGTALLILLGTAALAPPALATSALPSTTVFAATSADAGPARTDVHAVCPAWRQQITDALADAWRQVDREGTVQVRFTLAGREVSDVTTRGLRPYRRYIREAMQSVHCDSGESAPQVFAFNVRFVAPAAR